MASIVISIDRDKLPKHEKHEFDEWLEYQCGHGSLNMLNPLVDVDLDAEVKEISY